MSMNYEYCRARADEAATEAKAAELDNVRQRALRSEKTWRGLAEQARSVAENRERVEREKAAERERAAQG
ncbi:hypothetical protein MKP08_00950 [Erythrobacter sp. LQ02-29]|uniref:hypothetical protein n=1 Tax=unclassified Erythrobacter TaxID=2633097 RepID=UPI001BFC8C4D|nr:MULTISPECIES: hypothetical protein [unclassified Erythrobacter]MCP9221318.1 hypothetical protein [Erythrobacter sp. LQ02-29]QWC57340.1 hypothetical protein F7D01_09800 [Erythrobacter sp. 3-20A1M]